MAYVTAALPLAIVVVGMVLAIAIAVRFFVREQRQRAENRAMVAMYAENDGAGYDSAGYREAWKAGYDGMISDGYSPLEAANFADLRVSQDDF